MFKDGTDLFSEKLEKKIDEISGSFEGFYFGRFDVRFNNIERLKQGKDFSIIELNGAMSESTNLYDPKFSIFQSYSILFKQWSILFRIGYENYQRGYPLTSWKDLFLLLKNHFAYKKELDRFTEKV